jgi:hypothetical protein
MSDQLAVAIDLYPLRHQATPTHYYEFHLPRLSSTFKYYKKKLLIVMINTNKWQTPIFFLQMNKLKVTVN